MYFIKNLVYSSTFLFWADNMMNIIFVVIITFFSFLILPVSAEENTTSEVTITTSDELLQNDELENSSNDTHEEENTIAAPANIAHEELLKFFPSIQSILLDSNGEIALTHVLSEYVGKANMDDYLKSNPVANACIRDLYKISTTYYKYINKMPYDASSHSRPYYSTDVIGMSFRAGIRCFPFAIHIWIPSSRDYVKEFIAPFNLFGEGIQKRIIEIAEQQRKQNPDNLNPSLYSFASSVFENSTYGDFIFSAIPKIIPSDTVSTIYKDHLEKSVKKFGNLFNKGIDTLPREVAESILKTTMFTVGTRASDPIFKHTLDMNSPIIIMASLNALLPNSVYSYAQQKVSGTLASPVIIPAIFLLKALNPKSSIRFLSNHPYTAVGTAAVAKTVDYFIQPDSTMKYYANAANSGSDLLLLFVGIKTSVTGLTTALALVSAHPYTLVVVIPVTYIAGSTLDSFNYPETAFWTQSFVNVLTGVVVAQSANDFLNNRILSNTGTRYKLIALVTAVVSSYGLDSIANIASNINQYIPLGLENALKDASGFIFYSSIAIASKELVLYVVVPVFTKLGAGYIIITASWQRM